MCRLADIWGEAAMLSHLSIQWEMKFKAYRGRTTHAGGKYLKFSGPQQAPKNLSKNLNKILATIVDSSINTSVLQVAEVRESKQNIRTWKEGNGKMMKY